MNGKPPSAPLCATGSGLGNDFVIAESAALQRAGVNDLAAFTRQVCGQRWDGLLLLDGQSCRVLNRDGSDGGVCLNGLRVLARLRGGEQGVWQMAGRAVRWQRVDAGIALTLAASDLAECMVSNAFALGGGVAREVAFWNPHCVIEVNDPDQEDLPDWAHAARSLTTRFPAGVNVELVSAPTPDLRIVRVDERGVGETRACGSGALAVALAAWHEAAPRSLRVRLKGGELLLERLSGGGVRLIGEASVQPLAEVDHVTRGNL